MKIYSWFSIALANYTDSEGRIVVVAESEDEARQKVRDNLELVIDEFEYSYAYRRDELEEFVLADIKSSPFERDISLPLVVNSG